MPVGLIHAPFVQLACLFLQGCSAPQSCWMMVGVGLRLIQDVGKHRKRVYNSMDLAEAEQWRRTFWFVATSFFFELSHDNLFFHRVLVVLDRLMSASLGRPCAIQEEEYVASIMLSSESHDYAPALTLTCLRKSTMNTGRTSKTPTRRLSSRLANLHSCCTSSASSSSIKS